MTQIDKVLEKKHLTVSFGCFLSSSLKKHFMKNQKAQNLKLDRCMKTVFLPSVSPLNRVCCLVYSIRRNIMAGAGLLPGTAIRWQCLAKLLNLLELYLHGISLHAEVGKVIINRASQLFYSRSNVKSQ